MTNPGANELVQAVQRLNVTAKATAEALDALSERTTRNTVREWWHSFWIIVTGLSLFIDVAVTVVLFQYEKQQNCLSEVRAKSSAVAAQDRANQNSLILDILLGGKIKTRAQLIARARVFKQNVDANNAERDRIGVANTDTCPLF